MENFESKIAGFKAATVGAAYFRDNFTDRRFCANDLTKEQAKQFAQENNLTLLSWRLGETCGG